jgi:hypothetical protein
MESSCHVGRVPCLIVGQVKAHREWMLAVLVPGHGVGYVFLENAVDYLTVVGP